MKVCLRGGLVARKERLEVGDLFFDGDTICGGGIEADKVLHVPSNHVVLPGFIDIQINGGWGVDFSSEKSEWQKVADHLPETGVTSFLATIVSSPLEHYEKLLSSYHKKNTEGAELLGVHLEGPHIKAQFAGAHNLAALREDIDLEFWKFFLEKHRDIVKMVTLAPELKGARELISLLSSEHIIASCGHSGASKAQIMEAKNLGLSFCSHLFNCTRPMHHRFPGIVGAVLGEKALQYSLIADGVHLDDTAVKLCWNAYKDGLFLVSDLSPGYGVEKGATLAGRSLDSTSGASFITGTMILSGGSLPLHKMVLRLKEITGSGLFDAVQCVTEKPARLLGLEGKKGTLEIGASADIVICDINTLEPMATFIGGKLHAASCHSPLYLNVRT
jgi:N-acetylglucosamine-6-phosphate deacetylase